MTANRKVKGECKSSLHLENFYVYFVENFYIYYVYFVENFYI